MMDKIYLEDMVVRFSQEPDCCQKDDETQIIEIHSENNGVGNFFWLKTDRWSFSEPDDLVRLAKRIRAMEETNNKYENGEVIHDNNTDDKPIHNEIRQLEYVDLGLPSGTLWAKCNIGAASETEYGDYYMWGSKQANNDTTCGGQQRQIRLMSVFGEMLRSTMGQFVIIVPILTQLRTLYVRMEIWQKNMILHTNLQMERRICQPQNNLRNCMIIQNMSGLRISMVV